jgi:hypothetical protein
MRRALLAPLALAAVAALTSLSSPVQAESPQFSTPPAAETIPHRPVVRPAPAPRFEVVDDAGRSLPAFFTPQGQRFVLGALGDRYRIRISNPTPARMEAVVSIDGLDAIDGKPASFGKRGYIIPAFGDAVIDGWRTSLDTVAAFRFSSVRDSYAARTQSDRNVGVIGVAFFRENPPPPPPPIAWRAPAPSRGAAPGATPAPPSAGGPGAAAPKDADLSGIGTRFGESHDSHVTEVPFVRASATPFTLAEMRYDDRQGLLARGIALAPVVDEGWAERQRRDSAQPFAESRFAPAPR